jgi:ATP-binding cassette subfamily B protein
VLLLAQGLLPVATVYLSWALVDGLAAVLGKGHSWEAMNSVLLLVGLMALVILVGEVGKGPGLAITHFIVKNECPSYFCE